MHTEKNSLRFTAVDENEHEFMEFVVPKHADRGEFTRIGCSNRSSYINTIHNWDPNSAAQLCWNSGGNIVAAMSLNFTEGDAFVKTGSKLVSDAQVQEIIAEIVRLSEEQGSLSKLKICSLRKLNWLTSQLHSAGFQAGDNQVVFMERELHGSIPKPSIPLGFRIKPHDTNDKEEVQSRMLAQSSAFSNQDVDTLGEWAIKASEHMSEFSSKTGGIDLVMINERGVVSSAAGIDIDPINRIGEFEPVVTARRFQRKGHSKAILLQGLQTMKDAGMEVAYIRTDVNNLPAIKAYESVGFTIKDHSAFFTQQSTASNSISL